MANSLTQTAIVGTNNQASRLRDTDLLRQLGIRSMQRLAGFNPPVSDEALPETAPIGDEPICEQATVTQFFKLFNGSKKHFQTIWLRRFISSGQKFPNEFLPDLLSRLSIQPRMSLVNEGYLKLMSERVRWLVTFSEYQDWKKLVHQKERFEYREQEVAEDTPLDLFIGLRKHNPTSGIEWLSDNWHDIRADLQVDYLDALRIGLNPHDEAFLTNLLESDISFDLKTICDKAAYLLSLLEADPIQDTIEEIINMTFVAETKYHGWVLDFRWSDVFKETPIYTPMKDLWLPLANKYKWSGKLAQLLHIVPLEYWCRHYQLTPTELVAAIYNGLNSREFSEAWWLRLVDESREDFLRALLGSKVTRYWIKPWMDDHEKLENLSFDLFQIVVDEWLNNA